MEGLVSPVLAKAKSLESTPVTDSLNVTVQCTDDAFVGLVSARLMDETVGVVLSTVYTWPVKLPFPVPVPPSLFPAVSVMVSSSTRFSPSDPSPAPVEAVTVYEDPEPETPMMEGEVRPVLARAKSEEPIPVTVSENVTVQCTEDATVGLGST